MNPKVLTCTTGTGTYATFVVDKVETSVRLPNGVRRIAQDLEALADEAEQKAADYTRRAARLRLAAKSAHDGKVGEQS